MKIIMLCDGYFEGLQYQENLLTKYYLKHGHSVTIIASTFESVFDYYADKYDKNKPKSIIERGNLKIIKLPYSLNFLNKLRRFKNVKNILEKEIPDLIYIHGIHLNIFEAVSYKKTYSNCKIIIDSHVDFSNSVKNKLSLFVLHKFVRKFVLNSGLNYFDRIYSVTPASSDFLQKVYNIRSKKIELLPLGADMDVINNINKSNLNIKTRKNLNISSNAFIIFTGGKLQPSKKTEQLVKAINTINNPNIYLIVAGQFNKNEESYNKLFLKECNKNKNIKLMGWVDSKTISSLMCCSDIAVFPGSQSVMWQQCIGFGLPVVLGKFVNLKDGNYFDQKVEYLNFKNNVLILNEKNDKTNEIIIAIEKLLDQNLLKKMKLNAEYTGNNFLSYDIISKKTLSCVTD